MNSHELAGLIGPALTALSSSGVLAIFVTALRQRVRTKSGVNPAETQRRLDLAHTAELSIVFENDLDRERARRRRWQDYAYELRNWCQDQHRATLDELPAPPLTEPVPILKQPHP